MANRLQNSKKSAKIFLKNLWGLNVFHPCAGADTYLPLDEGDKEQQGSIFPHLSAGLESLH